LHLSANNSEFDYKLERRPYAKASSGLAADSSRPPVVRKLVAVGVHLKSFFPLPVRTTNVTDTTHCRAKRRTIYQMINDRSEFGGDVFAGGIVVAEPKTL
jgi:hypothetical protein